MHDKTGNRPSLPENWVWTTLGEICQKPQYGWTTSAATEGRLHLLRTTDITSGSIKWKSVPFCSEEPTEKEKYLLKDGDIVISRAGSVGFSHLVRNPEEAIFASYLIRFKPLIDQRYVALFLKSPSYWNAISEKSSGIAIPNVNATKLRQIKLPLPPLPEQRRIVDAIETQFTRLDAAVAALERIQAALERYRASVLKAACEGRLVPTETALARAEGRDYEPAGALLTRILAERRAQWEVERWQYEIERAKKKAAQAERKAAGLPYYIRDLAPEDWQNIPEAEYADYLSKNDKWKHKYEEPEPPDTEKLSELPEGWIWTTVNQLGAISEQPVLTGPFGSNLGRDDFINSGVPVLTIGCLTEQGIDLDKAFYISDDKAEELDRYQLEAGDLLFSRMATVGRAGLVPTRLEGAIINYHLMRLRLANSIINPNYFIAYVRGADTVVEYVREVNHGATRDGINTKQLLAMPVALPPLPEQRRIVAEVERRLSLVEALETAVATNLRRAERLRQSILKRAFEGRLVPQDPGDEPAAALLARVKAKRP